MFDFFSSLWDEFFIASSLYPRSFVLFGTFIFCTYIVLDLLSSLIVDFFERR